MRKRDSKPAVVVLVLASMAIWGYNARELFLIREGEGKDPFVADVAGGHHLHQRARILAGHQPPPRTEPRWDPFQRKSLVTKKQQVPPPKPQKKAPQPKPKPSKPPAPPFHIQYIGFMEGTSGAEQVLILKADNRLWFLHPSEWVGPWQLVTVDETLLVFRDEHQNREELAR